jgi:hypothetical protein
MKRNSILILLIALLILPVLSGCKNKEKKSLKELQEDFIQPPGMTVQKSDTDQVLSLVNLYLQYLEKGKVDNAMSMLYYLNKNSITALPPEVAKKERFSLNSFKGLKYQVDALIFLQEDDSEVKYSATLFKKKPGDNRPNKISFIIKPVRQKGKWYLTLADTQTETQKSEVEKFN